MKKICKSCGIEKNLTSYFKNSNRKDGVQPECKICMSNTVKNYRKKAKEEREKFDTLTLNLIGSSKGDYCQMYSFMSKIGYNPEMDIHLQFCEKWGISTYKERAVKHKNRFTYDDCKE
jgi:hypothetical protein